MKKRWYLKGEFGLWARHRLLTAEFLSFYLLFIYLFVFSLRFYLIG